MSKAKNMFKLCNQSMIFIVVSLVAFIYLIMQKFLLINLGVFIVFIALWTMILNCICKMGMKKVSWIMVVLPYVMFFLFVGIFSDMKRVVFKEGADEIISGAAKAASAVTGDDKGNKDLKIVAGGKTYVDPPKQAPVAPKAPIPLAPADPAAVEKCSKITVPGSKRLKDAGGGTDCRWNNAAKTCDKTDGKVPAGQCTVLYKNMK